MDETKFRQHLDTATFHLIEFTEKFCLNNFSNNYKYIITPSSRTFKNDHEHLNPEEIAVLKTWNKNQDKLLQAEQVVNLLHHDNKVPIWIDISVYEARPDVTVIDLLCSRRLREESELMHPAIPPFHLVVALPLNHVDVEISGKFDINWQKRRDALKNKGKLARLKQFFKL